MTVSKHLRWPSPCLLGEARVSTCLSTAGRQIHSQASASPQSAHSQQNVAPEAVGTGTIDIKPEQSNVPQQADGGSDDALVLPADIKRQLVLEEISRSGEMGGSSYRSDMVPVLLLHVACVAWRTRKDIMTHRTYFAEGQLAVHQHQHLLPVNLCQGCKSAVGSHVHATLPVKKDSQGLTVPHVAKLHLHAHNTNTVPRQVHHELQ